MSKEEPEKEMTVGRVVFGLSNPQTSWGFIGTHTSLPENFFGKSLIESIEKSEKTPPDPTTTERSSTHDQEKEERWKDDIEYYSKALDRVNCHCNELFPDLPQGIDSPSYYQMGGGELIDYLRDQGILEPWALGNAQKYLLRYKLKGSPLTDLQKAIKCIQILIEEVKDE